MTPKDLARSPPCPGPDCMQDDFRGRAGFRDLVISGAEDAGTRRAFSQVPRPIPGAHLLCELPMVGSRSLSEAARSCRKQDPGLGVGGSPAGERTVTLGPSPGQRGSPAGEPTVTLGSTRGSGCSYCRGRVNTTDENRVRAHWLRRCRQDSRPCPALQTSSCALVWLAAQQRAGLLPGKLGDRGPQSLRDREKQKPTRGYEIRQGKNHEGATCGRGRRGKRSASPSPTHPGAPHRLRATSSPVRPVI